MCRNRSAPGGWKSPGATSLPSARIALLDVWRGAAIVGVVLYHFGWDLSFFGYAPPDMMYSDAMIVFARMLAGSFMFLCGVGLVLAHGRAVDQKGFIRRFGKIVLSALAITVVTALLMSDVFVYFGILHAIAASSLLGLAFLRLPIVVVACAGIVVLLLGLWLQLDGFDTRWLAWIGFASNPPPSNDFVPLFPWFGIVLFGVAAARLIGLHPELARWIRLPAPGWLVWTGRRTLPIYLLHQPVLFAVIGAAAWIANR